jgi:hypothetical protein
MSIVLAVVLALVSQIRDSDPPGVSTTSLSGVVVDDAGAAVRRALVSLSGQTVDFSRSAVTDEGGRFRFDGIPRGQFLLRVEKPAYVTSQYGAKRPGRSGTAILVEDSAITGLVVRLWRGGVLGGTLRDELGRPVVGVTVRALSLRGTANSPFRSLTNNGVATGTRGEYRIFGLEPGPYVIAATPPYAQMSSTVLTDEQVDRLIDLVKRRTALGVAGAIAFPVGSRVAPAPVYFPGTPVATQARVITLASGTEQLGLDFPLHRVPTSTISGVVLQRDGKPAAGATMLLRVAGDLQLVPQAPFATVAASDGSFVLGNVQPGRYRIVARSAVERPEVTARQSYWATHEVDVFGTDVVGLRLTLDAGLSLQGRIAFAAFGKEQAKLPSYTGLVAVLRAQGGGIVADTAVRPDGTFVLSAPPDESCQLEVTGLTAQSPWFALSAIVDGRDLLDDFVRLGPGVRDVEVTFSDAPTRLTGRLQMPDGRGVSDVVILAFTAEAALWGRSQRRVKAVRPDMNGEFVIASLPAGSYFIGAVTDVDPVDWSDPAFLKRLSAVSAVVEITLGSSVRQDLRITGRDRW